MFRRINLNVIAVVLSSALGAFMTTRIERNVTPHDLRPVPWAISDVSDEQYYTESRDGGRYWWPSEFMTGDISHVTDRHLARADMLTAWGNCMAGNKPPANFGKAMAALSHKFDLPPTPDDLLAMKEE